MSDPDIAHINEYNLIREEHPHIPEWDALTDDQKVKVRAANEEKWNFFNELGKAISKGKVNDFLSK